MMDWAAVLGDIVRERRHQLGLTQAQVAEKAGIDEQTVRKIENYNGNPKMEVLFPIVRSLQIDPQSIFYPTEEPDSPARRRLEMLLSDCTDAQIEALIPVISDVLAIINANDIITIK